MGLRRSIDSRRRRRRTRKRKRRRRRTRTRKRGRGRINTSLALDLSTHCQATFEPAWDLLARLSHRAVVLGRLNPKPPSAVLASLAGLIRPALDGLGWAPLAIVRGANQGEPMLRIYDVILEVLRDLRPVLVQIETHDPSLGKQLRRCATSMALNTAEGSGCRGGTRRQRYLDALGSARESAACLDAADSLGYCPIDRALRQRIERVAATLVKNVT